MVRGAAAVRRRSGDRGTRPVAGGSRGGDGARRARGSRASQRAVPRAAAARTVRCGDERRRGSVRDRRRRPAAPLDDAAIDALAGSPRAARSAASSSRARTTTRPSPRRWRRSPAATGFPILADPLSGLRTGRPRPEPGDRTRGPARSAGRLDRRPSARPRHPDRRHAHLQADRGAAGADDAGADRARRGSGWRESALVPATFVHADPGRDRARDRREVPGPGRRLGVGRGVAPRRPGRGRGDGRLAGWARRAVRGRAVPGARGRPAGRVHALGRQLDAGPRHGRLAAVDGARRSRCARTAARTGSTASCRRCSGPPRSLPGRLRSSWATCRSCTTSTRSSRRSCTTCPRRSSSSTTMAAASSRSSRRRRQPSPGPASRTGTRSCSGRPTGSTSAPIVTALGGEHVQVGPEDLRAQVERSIGCPGVQVLELRTDRARNVALHREVAAVVAAAIRP